MCGAIRTNANKMTNATGNPSHSDARDPNGTPSLGYSNFLTSANHRSAHAAMRLSVIKTLQYVAETSNLALHRLQRVPGKTLSVKGTSSSQFGQRIIGQFSHPPPLIV